MSIEEFNDAIISGDVLGAIMAAKKLTDINMAHDHIKRMSPLHYALWRDNTNVVEGLLGLGASVSATNDRGSVALHFAASKVAAQSLVDYGANIRVVNQFQRTPLHVWPKRDTDILYYLVGLGADINLADVQGSTPLHSLVTSSWRSEGFVKHLATLGANLDLQDVDGYTPLHKAARKCNATAVEELLEAGASLGIKNHAGQTASDIADWYGSKVIKDLFKAAI